MFADKPGAKELVIAYAQKFWDAGNSIVTIIFGLAFAVYFALAQFDGLRPIVHRHIVLLVALALVGNILLGIVLWRLCLHEKRTIQLIVDDPTFLDSVQSAFEIRLGLLIFNTVMYLGILWFVWANTPPSVVLGLGQQTGGTLAHADFPFNRRDAMSGTNGGTLFGFLTGVLTSSVVAAIVTQLFSRSRDRSLGQQKIMEFLTKERQELSNNPELLETIGFLERETGGDASNPPSGPRKMRELPGFLEPIGVYLEFNPDAFQRAYQVFAKEVELCANSHYLWLKDDLQPSEGEHYSTSPYWMSFRQFVANTRQNLAEQRLPPAKRVAHRLARHVLNWLEA